MARQTPADSRSMIRFIIVSETRYREGWYKGCSASLACNEIRRDPNSKFVLRLLDSSAPAAFYCFVEIRVSQWTTNRISRWSLSRRIRWRNPSVLSYASATSDAWRVIFPGCKRNESIRVNYLYVFVNYLYVVIRFHAYNISLAYFAIQALKKFFEHKLS